MQYLDSRRVINPIYQDQPKQVRPRSISNTTKLLAWDTQQINSKNDNIKQPTSSDVRHAQQNQRNVSSILGGNNFIKVINQQPYYNLNDIIKHQHVVQSTKEKIINPNKLFLQDEIQTQQDSKSQERHSIKSINLSKGEKENQFKNQQELIRLNKTENVKTKIQGQKEESKQLTSELKRRMMNNPQKQQIPSQINNPKSILQMEDNNITIITMQLKDIKNDIQTQEMKQLCQNIGYHMIKFDKEYDKINHRQNGQGSIQIRGINTDQKLTTLQRSLSRKGINIGEQNLKLKNFTSNKYLLKSQEHSQTDNQYSQNQEEKLLNNFRKFQSRQKGQFQ